MTDLNQGVAEVVAEPQPEQESQPTNQEMNWKAANDTLAQQKQRLGELERSNQVYQQQLSMVQSHINQQAQAASAQAPVSPMDGMPGDDLVTVADFNKAVRGEYVGIGSVVRYEEPHTIIVTPMDGSPSLRSGLRPGDKIVEVDGQVVGWLCVTDCGRRCSVPAGSM